MNREKSGTKSTEATHLSLPMLANILCKHLLQSNYLLWRLFGHITQVKSLQVTAIWQGTEVQLDDRNLFTLQFLEMSCLQSS